VNGTLAIDLNWENRPRSIASALFQSGDTYTLIDPGPSSTLPALKHQLALHGLKTSDLHAVFLTHIHLDHAGATGALVQENPQLRVYVHSQGAPHMVHPAKLLKSAALVFGPEMFRLFGEFLPVPASNLHVLEGGETIRVGERQLQVVYTPGHASHHVTYFDREEGTAFVGDTAGICIEGHPFVLPATPPPDVSLELWDRSLDAIAELQPKRIFLTHFGLSHNPESHLSSFRARLHRWAEITARILSAAPDEKEASRQFQAAVSAEATPFLTSTELSHLAFNGNLPLSYMGLARYHAKRLSR
jgi:glyoxylase-like metal-dependent hydrolase (beta-lactamase superfamily II)